MKLLWSTALALSLFSLSAFAQSSAEEEAGDVSEVDKDALGPLRERVQPVSGHLFLKKNRFEASPGVTLSVKDAFYSKYLLGISLTYFASETLGFSLRGAYSIPVVSGAASLCEQRPEGRVCRSPLETELDQKAPGKILLTAGLDVQWAPIYGKISLISERFAHFDMYGILGASGVQYLSHAGPTFTVGGNVGLGTRFYFNKWLCLRAELRDLIYVENTSATTTSLRNQILVEFGVSMFFPTTFDEG